MQWLLQVCDRHRYHQKTRGDLPWWVLSQACTAAIFSSCLFCYFSLLLQHVKCMFNWIQIHAERDLSKPPLLLWRVRFGSLPCCTMKCPSNTVRRHLVLSEQIKYFCRLQNSLFCFCLQSHHRWRQVSPFPAGSHTGPSHYTPFTIFNGRGGMLWIMGISFFSPHVPLFITLIHVNLVSSV